MINPGIVIFGIFILAVTLYTEGQKRKERKEQGVEYERFSDGDYVEYIMIYGIVLLLVGLGFLLEPVAYAVPSWSLIVPFYLGFVAVASANQNKGIGTLIAKIAGITVFIFLIMGSFY